MVLFTTLTKAYFKFDILEGHETKSKLGILIITEIRKEGSIDDIPNSGKLNNLDFSPLLVKIIVSRFVGSSDKHNRYNIAYIFLYMYN